MQVDNDKDRVTTPVEVDITTQVKVEITTPVEDEVTTVRRMTVPGTAQPTTTEVSYQNLSLIVYRQ